MSIAPAVLKSLEPRGISHGLFDIVVILKGPNGLTDIASGTVLFLLQSNSIMVWVNWLTQLKLIEDPLDICHQGICDQGKQYG